MPNVKPLEGGVGEPKVCAEGVSAGGLGTKSEALAGVVGRAAAGLPRVCVERPVRSVR